MAFHFLDGSWDLRAQRVFIMGILNVTPDSFSDGGQFASLDRAIEHAERLAREGADAVDIGGESTRPGSDPVSATEEMNRVLPVIRELRQKIHIPLSIDTTKADVAAGAIECGASIVNDVTAGCGDREMLRVVAGTGAGIILMHMKGTPRAMQADPQYEDVVGDIRAFLDARVTAAVSAGIGRDHIAIDPGIGFGKTLQHNLLLLRNLSAIASLGMPVVIGTSRKAFIGRITGQDLPEARIDGTIASSLYAVAQGAHILRVHDVAAVKRALDVWLAIERSVDGAEVRS